MDNITLKGAKGGGGGAPSQSPDTLASVTYAQILDLISEGPIYGPPSGNPAQSVYLNDVPLQNPDGSTNFQIDGFDFRYGDVDQTHIGGFAGSQQITNVGVELKQVVPWSVVVTDTAINSIVITLGVSALSQTSTSNGDVSGYEVAYQVQLSVDGGAYATVVNTSFSGKCTSAYQRSHKIPLSGAAKQYMLRVVRTTPDTTSVYIQDKTQVISYSLVVDAKLRYPFSAFAALSVNAVEFSSVPTRSYDLKGLLVNVPSNYNPDTRAYSGTWDGTFKRAWTDNPAWIFYDLVLNNRYGLGQWVSASMVDRYALYQIAQYCDVPVSDGAGGTEPRFTCNAYLATRADAYRVLQDLASIFRGMAYWSAGAVIATADMPADPVYVYTGANVIDGQFKYAGSALKTRYTAAAVTWNDPANGYKQAVEYVQDADGLARYGLNEAQMTAFGCASRGQAQRAGQWLLLTSRYETNAVTFSVGLDGALAMPGQIIAIADANRAGKRTAGRLRAVANTTTVTLDSAVAGAAVGDRLTVIMPDGIAASSKISALDATGTQVTVRPAFAQAPAAGAVWMIESANVQAQLYRVTAVAEKDGIAFEVTATQYEPAKYAAVDNGAAMDVRPVTGNRFTVQAPPAGVTCAQYVVIDQGIARTSMTLAWKAAENAVSYTVQWQKDNGTWVAAGTTGATSVDVANVYGGQYLARVCATNGMGIASPWAYSALTALKGKTGAPPKVASFTASTDVPFAVNLAWTFPAGAGDTAYTEIRYGMTRDFAQAKPLGQYGHPTNTASVQGLAAGASLYFWARLVDTSGNVGAWFPDASGAGVNGQASAEATTLLTYLTKQITQSQLAQDVLAPVQAVGSLSAGLGAAQSSMTGLSSALASTSTSASTGLAGLSSGLSSTRASLAVTQGSLSTLQDSLSSGLSSAQAGLAVVQVSLSAAASGLLAEATARGAADTRLSNAIQDASTSFSQRMDTLTASLGSTAAALQTEQTARASGDAANAAAISQLQAVTFVPMAGAAGDFAGATAVYAGVYSEQSARADADGALAQSIAALSTSFANGLAAAGAAITAEAATRASADGALATTVTGLAASFSSSLGATSANLASEQTARANADSALVVSLTGLTASVSTGLSTAAANLVAEQSARADGDSANTHAISQLQAATFVPMAGATADFAGATAVYAGVWSEQAARTDADSALAQSIAALSTSFVNGMGAADAAVTAEASARASADSALSHQLATLTATVATTDTRTAAAISSEQTARAGGDAANAAALSTLTATVSSNSTTASAALTAEASTRASADGALTQNLAALSASFNTGLSTASANLAAEQTARANGDGANAASITALSTAFSSSLSTTNAAITAEQNARAAADSASASSINTVAASLSATSGSVSNLAATVQANYDTYATFANGVNASYTIKTQVSSNGKTYIAGIGVGVNASGGTVTSQVLVAASQFSVIDPDGSASASPFTISGGQVYINQALIGTGWITNAMIGNTIQSTATGANGKPLWVIDKASGITFNGPNGGSGYMTINSSTLQVYDGNGTLRVRLGIW